MSHVDEAINEMFQATHMQMMRNCCRLEKMLLAAILMESRARGHSLHCVAVTPFLTYMPIGMYLALSFAFEQASCYAPQHLIYTIM